MTLLEELRTCLSALCLRGSGFNLGLRTNTATSNRTNQGMTCRKLELPYSIYKDSVLPFTEHSVLLLETQTT